MDGNLRNHRQGQGSSLVVYDENHIFFKITVTKFYVHILVQSKQGLLINDQHTLNGFSLPTNEKCFKMELKL